MPLTKIDYSRTIIYKIVCNDLNVQDVYVGHTTDFIRRKREHKSRFYSSSIKYKIYEVMRNNGGWDNWSMIEVMKFPCSDKNEAVAKEREFFEQMQSTLNSRFPMRLEKETVFEANKKWSIKKLEWARNDKIKNPDKYKLKYEQYYNEYCRSKCECSCGRTIAAGHLKKHLKTKYHNNHL